MFDCMVACDNDLTCAMFSHDGSTCRLHETGGLGNPMVGTVCGVKSYVAPHNAYSAYLDMKTICNVSTTNGTLLFDDDGTLPNTWENADDVECASLCNTYAECTAYEWSYEDNSCTFYKGLVLATETNVTNTTCWMVETGIMSDFYVHPDSTCGVDVVDTAYPAVHDQHSCWLTCQDDPKCAGFEYVGASDLCITYGSVSLTAFEGRDCYRRMTGLNTYIGQQIGRLIFPEAVFNQTLHGSQEFKDHVEMVIESVIGTTINLTGVVDAHEYGIYVDYVVDQENYKALHSESVYIILDNVDPQYGLGNQVLGGYKLPPPTSRPSQSPTVGPTGAPTTPAPSVTPTQSPTEAASEIVYRYGALANTTCGPADHAFRNFSGVDAVDCMKECDNSDRCHEATFEDSHCHLHGATSILHRPSGQATCLQEQYVGPHHSYFENEDTACSGSNGLLNYLFHGLITSLENTDYHECAQLCNNYYECEAFQTDGTNCILFNQTHEHEDSEPGITCYHKDLNIMGAFAGHENMGCGNDVLRVSESVPHSYHTCYFECSDDFLCAGFEFYNSSKICMYYSSVSLVSSTGRTCHKRAFDNAAFQGKHLARINFVDAVYDEAVHGAPEFKDYMRDVLKQILGRNVTILDVLEGSVIVEFAVDGHGPAFVDQEGYLIKDRVVADGTYDLGTQVIVGNKPPPPTLSPTGHPTTSRPTGGPTGGPTTAHKKTVNDLFSGHHTVEILAFTLIAVAGAAFVYVGIRFAMILFNREYANI